ncbi:hypothetical protein SK803_17505 [Lentzea sp. BCCO 10_0856]|uniref:Uncharacterized protein n=1 Tax=Lentzea miocenica TaxID=3095431 RepID=A0ABU4T1J0_9PSEU|nr:hypothetical protein [Lentzea sp. BCCO 10_0856]MDX8032025.1 hypothetical protein [Lentzea sp. BCCO 10_0856]
MSRRGGGGGCALLLFAVFFGLPLTMVLVAPAVAARIYVDDLPQQASYLHEWLWGSAAAVPLGMLAVRSAHKRGGRLRRSSLPKRWLGLLERALVLLAVLNVFTFVAMQPGEHVINDGLTLFGGAALAGLAVLFVMRLWDRRERRVTVQEVRAAAAEADRALQRVRSENARVRRQAEQVQARLVKLQARGPARGADVEFHSLRVFHRESYQCADTAHIAYHSAQTSMRTMSSLVRRARRAPLQLTVSKRARAEMRAAADHLASSHGELRSQVDQGLDMVRSLNANTSELKHEIRDSCGRQGQEWFEALEERIEQAREERRVVNRFGGGQ